jgi:hypothetical protein
MAWLVVLSDASATRWVLEHRRMAFRANVSTHALKPDAPIALYVTRGAFHNPTRDESQIVAVGRVASFMVEEAIEVAGQRYERWCGLEFDATVPLRKGLPFRTLVKQLMFIANKDAWAAYVRRTLVPLPPEDFDLIHRTFLEHVARGPG